MRMVMDLAITPREPMEMIVLEYLARLLKTEMVVRTRMAMVIQTVMQVGPQHRVQTPSRVNLANGLTKTEMVMETTQAG